MGKYDLLPVGGNPLEHFRPGVTPSPADGRDWHLSAVQLVQAALPVRAECPALPVGNQDQWGSCAVFSVLRLFAGDLIRQGGPLEDYSEQFLYALARKLENSLCENAGTVPRDLMGLLTGTGIILESVEPYESQNLCWAPSDTEIATAAARKAQSYAACRTLDDVRAAVAAGRRVMLCMTLLQNFAPDANGVIPTPAGAVWGGHAMTICGYDDTTRLLKVENQWSTGWGVGGYCFISYDLFNLSEAAGGAWKGDLWTLQVPAPKPNPGPRPAPARARVARAFTANAANGTGWQPAGQYDIPAGATDLAVGAVFTDTETLASDDWAYLKIRQN